MLPPKCDAVDDQWLIGEGESRRLSSSSASIGNHHAADFHHIERPLRAATTGRCASGSSIFPPRGNRASANRRSDEARS